MYARFRVFPCAFGPVCSLSGGDHLEGEPGRGLAGAGPAGGPADRPRGSGATPGRLPAWLSGCRRRALAAAGPAAAGRAGCGDGGFPRARRTGYRSSAFIQETRLSMSRATRRGAGGEGRRKGRSEVYRYFFGWHRQGTGKCVRSCSASQLHSDLQASVPLRNSHREHLRACRDRATTWLRVPRGSAFRVPPRGQVDCGLKS